MGFEDLSYGANVDEIDQQIIKILNEDGMGQMSMR
jgi:hypothetical protein